MNCNDGLDELCTDGDGRDKQRHGLIRIRFDVTQQNWFPTGDVMYNAASDFRCWAMKIEETGQWANKDAPYRSLFSVPFLLSVSGSEWYIELLSSAFNARESISIASGAERLQWDIEQGWDCSHCPHSMRSRIYETIERPSVRKSVLP